MGEPSSIQCQLFSWSYRARVCFSMTKQSPPYYYLLDRRPRALSRSRLLCCLNQLKHTVCVPIMLCAPIRALPPIWSQPGTTSPTQPDPAHPVGWALHEMHGCWPPKKTFIVCLCGIAPSLNEHCSLYLMENRHAEAWGRFVSTFESLGYRNFVLWWRRYA